MSQWSHVALTPGETPTLRDKQFANQPMGCTAATTLFPPDSEGQTPNLPGIDPFTTQNSSPSNQMPTGPTRPGCQSSDNQPVNSEGVAPESMHVGQGQQNDRRVQAVDLQPQVSPIRIPLSQLLIHSLNPEVTTKIIGIQQVRLKWVDIGIISMIDNL